MKKKMAALFLFLMVICLTGTAITTTWYWVIGMYVWTGLLLWLFSWKLPGDKLLNGVSLILVWFPTIVWLLWLDRKDLNIPKE